MDITKEVSKKSFWALKISEVLDLLETTTDGLTAEEVAERAKIFGKNEISKEKKIAKLRILFNQFKSPLIFLLIIAGGITILLKDYTDAIVILAAALVN